MTTQHDVVVIGGGVAGLATGALLAQAGRSVAVLEKGNQLGGRAYTYTDKGFVLNFGAHALYRPHSGLLKDILHRLGHPPIDAPYPDPLRSYFAVHDRWGALGAKPHEILRTPLLPFGARLRLMLLLSGIRMGNPERLGDATVSEWLNGKTSDPYLRSFLLAFATLNTYTRPAGELSAQFLVRHIKRNLFAKDVVGYMSGGWATMYETFASAIREHGGEIVTGAAVDRLAVENGRVAAALAGDQHFEASSFVVALPPQDAPELADPGSALRDELDRWSGLVDVRALCIDLGFSRRLRSDLGFIFDAQRDLYFSLHSETTPDLAPEGGQLLHAMAYLSPEESSDGKLNESRLRELEAGLDQHFEGWRAAAVVQRTLRSALVTSARRTPGQSGAARVPARAASVSNVYFAGDSRDLPHNLTDTCLASALEVADLIGAEAPAKKAAVAVA